MNIHIFRTSGVSDELFAIVHRTLSLGNKPAIIIKQHDKPLNIRPGVYDESFYFNFCQDLRKSSDYDIGDVEIIVLLTEQRNRRNHFNGIDFRNKNCFVQTNDYDFIVEKHAGFPVAYLTLASAILTKLDLETAQSLLRQTTGGTMMDYTGNKSDIIFKIKTADIDLDTIKKLISAGVTIPEMNCIFSIFENIRKVYIGNNTWYQLAEQNGGLTIADGDKSIILKLRNLDVSINLQPKNLAFYLFVLCFPNPPMNKVHATNGRYNKVVNDIYEAISGSRLNWKNEWMSRDNLTETVSHIKNTLEQTLGKEIAKNYIIINQKTGYKCNLPFDLVSIETKNESLVKQLDKLRSLEL